MNSKNDGVDIRATDFFKHAKRSNLWPEPTSIHRSAVTKARKKLSWRVFENIFYDAVNIVHHSYPHSPLHQWKKMFVFAIDGSKYLLPATDELREKFDPNSRLHNCGKGHYPQCLVTTIYDVFRRFPIARSVAANNASERDEFIKLLHRIPVNQLLLMDRGYPSYEIFKILNEQYSGHYIFRCNATHTFPAVEQFIKSDKNEDIIYIDPSYKYSRKVTTAERKQLRPIKLRVIKLVNAKGDISVLLTNLFDKQRYTQNDIRALYFRRWEVETYYRDEKVSIEIEKFHSKSYNGIMQELFSVAIMSVIARFLMQLVHENAENKSAEPQFKHAVKTFANEIAVLTAEKPNIAIDIFKELLHDIARIRYYKPKTKPKSQPRISKMPVNKWTVDKIKKLKNT